MFALKSRIDYLCAVKLLCMLLSLYVVLLSAKPCCADKDCKRSAKQEQSNKRSDQERECAGCSPFFTCGNCAGFIVTQLVLLHLPLIIESMAEHVSTYQQPRLEKVALSVWLPPELS